jgi:hypothetical protein
MVSVDRFRQELLAQLRRSAKRGHTELLVNADDLCRSLHGSGISWESCCDAMQEEIKPGDTLVLARTSGAGLTVRYLLPRRQAPQA